MPTSFQPIPDEIRAQLAPGEQVLWHGQPRQGLMLRASDVYMIPFSLVWCGIVAHNIPTVWNSNMPGPSRLLPVVFIVFGLYFLFGRFMVDAATRAHTRYALTRERVLIVSGSSARSVRSLPLKTLGEINLTQHGSGEGTIVFGHDAMFARPAGMEWLPSVQPVMAPRFERIPDADAVHALIRDAQRVQLRA